MPVTCRFAQPMARQSNLFRGGRSYGYGCSSASSGTERTSSSIAAFVAHRNCELTWQNVLLQHSFHSYVHESKISESADVKVRCLHRTLRSKSTSSQSLSSRYSRTMVSFHRHDTTRQRKEREFSTVLSSSVTAGRKSLDTSQSRKQAGSTRREPCSKKPTKIEPSKEARKAFRQYQEARNRLKELRGEKERTKSEKMYKAWQRAEEKATASSRDAGVVVVKTLVKHVNKEKTRNEGQLDDESDEDYWKRRGDELLETAAVEFGHPEAMVLLGNHLLEETHKMYAKYLRGISKDDATSVSFQEQADREREKEQIQALLERVLSLYREAGTRGASKEAWFNLGHLLWTGYPDQSGIDTTDKTSRSKTMLQADPIRATSAFEKAVDLGDVDAMYFVGVQMLSSTCEVRVPVETYREGLQLIEEAAKSGHGGALFYLAVLHLNGHEALKIPACSDDDFVRRLDLACEQEDADALFLRGHCWYHGEHGYTPQDVAKALSDFLLATDHGSADAAVSAGAILHKGYPPAIPRNPERAFQLYQQAGELGSIEGWRNVVDCYVTGEGVPKSLETAKYIARTMLKDDGQPNNGESECQ